MTLKRSPILQTYDLDGHIYTEEEILELHTKVLAEFQSENPAFIGSKIIYALVKTVPNDTAQHFFDVIPRLRANYSHIFAGVDLVGQEDISPLIIDFIQQLLGVAKDVNFYFHAGETNWYGSIDLNLVSFVNLLAPVYMMTHDLIASSSD